MIRNGCVGERGFCVSFKGKSLGKERIIMCAERLYVDGTIAWWHEISHRLLDDKDELENKDNLL